MNRRPFTLFALLSALLLVLAACNTAAPMVALTVETAGDGSGTVVSSPAGIDVASADAPATAEFSEGASVTLTATAAAGSTFTGWTGGGCDAETGNTCTVTLNDATTVTATFATETVTTFDLTVATDGDGAGIVTSDPAGIDCGTDCVEAFVDGTSVTLTATPDAGSTFVGWTGGGCDAETGNTCTVSVDAATTVTATFGTAPTFELTVTTDGDGTGTVTSDPAGIDCGTDCTEAFADGTTVTLTATADTGSDFTGWTGGGCDAETGNTCTVTVDQATTVNATFAVETVTSFALTVTTDGDGNGTVSSDPAGIDCGTDCSEEFDEGTSVTLTATPDASSEFGGWAGGGCDAETGNTCTVSVDAATGVTATFTAASTSTVLEVQVNNTSDDAEEWLDTVTVDTTDYPAGTTYTTSSDLEVTFDPGLNDGAGVNQLIGLRFESVALPAGAVIESAVLEFVADGSAPGGLELTIVGEATAAPETFPCDFSNACPTTPADPSARARTSATQTWTPGATSSGDVIQTADLTAIVNEILGLSGWASGNAMVFLVEDVDASSLNLDVRAYTQTNPGVAPKLVIEYTTP